MKGEGPGGLIAFVAGLLAFVTLFVLAATHTLFGVIWWLVTLTIGIDALRTAATWAVVAAAVVGLAIYARRGGFR